jgi:hypothetical protein
MRSVEDISPAEALFSAAPDWPDGFHGTVLVRGGTGKQPALPAAVWRQLGIVGRAPDDRTAAMGREALAVYLELARPIGVVEDLTAEECARVFHGEGRNEPGAPVGAILPRARRLALFAATLGTEVSRRITALFDRQDFALGAVLDAVASVAADGAVSVLEQRFTARLALEEPDGAAPAVLAYSPGYCGWHMSGQQQLFAKLRPEEAGITLRPSCLMEPLKSVSGVLVAGSAEIHRFGDDFPFCSACATHACRVRQARHGE